MARVLKYLSDLFATTCILTFAISFYAYVYKIPENRCEMTYMFQWPEYLEISMPKEVKAAFPRYGLYVYGEGQYAESLRRGEFRGIPVLFVPGNAGSHRQVRSLGSVSMTKTERSSQYNVPEFNYFSIDFDEELSGLYGGYLQRQTEYAAKCIRRILSLYRNQVNRPKSLIVVGHSMGGVVARGLFATQNFSSSLIKVLLTLASPHAAPVATFDIALERYYAQIGDYWSKNVHETLQNLSVLSISGGGRDVMVRSDLTKFERRLKSSVYSKERNDSGLMLFETTAPMVPLVWATTDHLCIVWCKQLVLATVRALFDMAKPAASREQSRTASFSQNVTVHRKAIKYHFFDRDDWKLNLTAKKAYEIMLEDEKRMQRDPWSKLALVVRDYIHLMPSICVCYICLFLIFGYHIQENLLCGRFRSSIVRIFGFSLISMLFALRIKNDGDFASAVMAVLMAYGLFSMATILAAVLLTLTRCCRPSCSASPKERAHSRFNHLFLLAVLLFLLLTSMYSMALVVLFCLICCTVFVQVRSTAPVDEKSEKRARLVVQACLMLASLLGPWTVVSVQNFMRGGTILPHDPAFVPALLWILANLFSTLCQLDRFEQSAIALIVGLVTIGFCDRLYSTIYCCSVLSGFYSRMGRSVESTTSLSKVD